jgi:hypothetical protein
VGDACVDKNAPPPAPVAASQASAPVAAPGGQACAKSNDCPGELLCVAHKCQPPDAAPATAAAAAPATTPVPGAGPAGTIKVNFKPKTDGEPWVLTDDSNGAVICRLPCTAWVLPAGGTTLIRDTGSGAPPTSDMPKVTFGPVAGIPAGTELDATVRGPHGSVGAGIGLTVGGSVGVVIGGVTTGLGIPPVGIPFLVLGFGTLIPGIVVLAVSSGHGEVTVQPPAPARASFVVHAGFAGVEATSGARFGVTSEGLGATF